MHQAIELDTQKPMPQLQTTVIPHGSYQFSEPQQSPEEVRKESDGVHLSEITYKLFPNIC